MKKYPDYDQGRYCSTNGHCTTEMGNTGLVCKCDHPNWSGINCEIGPCEQNPCKNGGSCQYDDNKQIFCVCLSGWEGEFCQKDVLRHIIVIASAIIGATACCLLLLCVSLQYRRKFAKSPKKVITGKNWKYKIYFSCYKKDSETISIVTDKIEEIITAINDKHPNAMDSKIVHLSAYGSKLALIDCLCCCRAFAAKIGRHVFVEAKTEAGVVWSFEKVTAGIIVQVSEDEVVTNGASSGPSVRILQDGGKRGKIEKSVEDDNPKNCSANDILEWIISKELAKRYHLATSNCAFFANNLFVNFANEPYPIEPHELKYEQTERRESNNDKIKGLEMKRVSLAEFIPDQNV